MKESGSEGFIKYIFCMFMFVFMLLLPTSVHAQSSASSWAEEGISKALASGLVPIQLQGDYTRAISREEYCELIIELGKSLGIDIEEWGTQYDIYPDPNAFSDTANPDVLSCAAFGIVEGDGNGNFMPTEALSRQEAACILFRTYKVFIEQNCESSSSSDNVDLCLFPHPWEDGARIADRSRDCIDWCYRKGLMHGTSYQTFQPDSICTREQAILTVLRLYNVEKQPEQLQLPPTDYYPLFDSSDFKEPSQWIDSNGKTYTNEEIAELTNDNTLPDYSIKIQTPLLSCYDAGFIPWFGAQVIQTGDLYKTWLMYPTGKVLEIGEMGSEFKNITIYVDSIGHKTGIFITYVFDAPGEKYIYDLDKGVLLSEEPYNNVSTIYEADPFIFCPSGNGVYASQQTDEEIIIHGYSSQDISIQREDNAKIQLCGFINGLLAVHIPGQKIISYYTPSGCEIMEIDTI